MDDLTLSDTLAVESSIKIMSPNDIIDSNDEEIIKGGDDDVFNEKIYNPKNFNFL